MITDGKGFVTKGTDDTIMHIAHGNSYQVNVTEEYTETPDSSAGPQASGYVVLLPPPECVPRMKLLEYPVPVAPCLLETDHLHMAIEAGSSDAGVFACLYVVERWHKVSRCE